MSNKNKRYKVSFIDDYNRKFQVYFLVENLETYTTFRKYKNHVEKEIS